MSEFGDYVKSARTDLDLSLQDLAERSGLTKAYIWELEQGRANNPTAETIVRVAIALDIEAKTVFMFAEADCVARLKVTHVQHKIVAKEKRRPNAA